MQIYKADSGSQEHVENLLELLSMREMGKAVSVLQMVMYEDGSVGVDTDKIKMNDLLLFKGHLELAITDRYLTINGIHSVDPFEDEDEEGEEEDSE